jgi:hypothetical protein
MPTLQQSGVVGRFVNDNDDQPQLRFFLQEVRAGTSEPQQMTTIDLVLVGSSRRGDCAHQQDASAMHSQQRRLFLTDQYVTLAGPRLL